MLKWTIIDGAWRQVWVDVVREGGRLVERSWSEVAVAGATATGRVM